MKSFETTQAMVIIQPAPEQIKEEFYSRGEMILPKSEGEWVFFLIRRIFRKGEEFRGDPTLEPGKSAGADCLVSWSKVNRAPSIAQAKTPLIVPH